MPEQTPAGLRRATWATILERDVDLVLLDLLHTSPAFRAWILSQVADDLLLDEAEPEFVGAWHSVNTPNGESDVEAEWLLRDGRRLVVLVEDKIGAAFQPEQGLRYRARADAYVMSGRAAVVRTVLTAPAGYPARDPAGAAPFEGHVSLEAILDWCRSAASGERGSYLASFLEHTLRRYSPPARARTGGKPHYPEMYEVIRRVLTGPRHGLTLTVSSSTPGEWVYLRFDGREPGVSMRWRLPDHWVELVVMASRISRTALEQALVDVPLVGAAVTDRGTSEHVVWVPTPEIDLLAPAEIQTAAVAEALDIASGLASWYGKVKSRLAMKPPMTTPAETAGGVL